MLVALAILLVFIATFLAASIAVMISALVLRQRVLEQATAGEVDSLDQPLLLREESLSTISVWHELLTQFNFVTRLKKAMTEAGLRWSVGRVTATMLLTGALAWAVIDSIDWTPPGAGLAAGIGGAMLPYMYINYQRARRFGRIEEQFPDALDSLSRAMRAGHPFSSGMEMLAYESPAPLCHEMRKAYDEWKLGGPWNQALDNLSRRVPLLEVRLFTAAVLLQSKTGGKLNEVLERLADTIRDSIALRGDVRAISAHGRLTGTILTVMPIGIAAVMATTSSGYLSILIKNPLGPYLIAASVLCLVLGHFVIRQIVKIRI